MYKHHEESIENLIKLFKDNDQVLAILLGGSLAKGLEKETSDVDSMIILSSDAYEISRAKGKLSECISGHCTYEGGYFDIKYFNKDYLVQAAEKGSEPTRNSFIDVKCLYSKDPEIEDLIEKIPQYPIHEKQEKIFSFLSALKLNSGYFWGEVKKTNDLYLKSRVVSDIVLFGLRMILAYNEKLFPCHKWLMHTVEKVKDKPDDIILIANEFLNNPTDETKDRFVDSIMNFNDWGHEDFSEIVTRFIDDNEWWWWNHRPNIIEW